MNLLEEAIIYSTVMYQGMTRKIDDTPFILHPLEVAHILSTMTDDMEIIAAGVLHDIVEDTDGTLAEIEKRFGGRVAGLVESETEDEFPGEDKAISWKKRKDISLKKLKGSPDTGVKMLWLADKLSNMRSLAGGYGQRGDKVWDLLNQKDPEMHQWYYRTVAEYIELDLNKTGAYKEFIDRINYIWPGTFDTAKTRYKEYREISVDGCACIGRGAKSEVYRYSDELIVKVYNHLNTYKDVERERSLARTAFIMGLPTAISFGIVSVGDKYGAMYELIDAKTFSELIAKSPEHVAYYAETLADLAHSIHGIQADEDTIFPDASLQLESWVNRALSDEEPELADRIMSLVSGLPAGFGLVHGDFHTGNVFLSNGEPLIIDLDRMSVGPPIVDISSVYLFYVGFTELGPGKIEDFMGFSAEVAGRFYAAFIKQYLGTDDAAAIESATQKAALMANVRLVGQIKKKKDLSDAERSTVDRLFGKIRSGLDGVADLVI